MLNLPLQVILGSMQLSKFKPGGLVIGSLASNIPRAIPHTQAHLLTGMLCTHTRD